MKTKGALTSCCSLRSQGVELFGRRLIHLSCVHQLPFANGMHALNAGTRTPRCPKRVETEHGPRDPFDRPMVLFNEVIQIFGVPDQDSRLGRLVVPLYRCCVAPTAVDGELLRCPLSTARFV